MRKRYCFSVIMIVVTVMLLASCGKKEVKLDEGVIHYPGLAWNMTQEEVMKALDINARDIMPNGNTPGPMRQVFCVENWKFLGQKGTILFEFLNSDVDCSEEHFGLRRVVIFYPEHTDVAALEKEMAAMLGEGRPVSDGKWLRWDSEKMYADYMEKGMAELKERYPEQYDQQVKFSEGVCASFATFHYDASDGSFMNLAPYEGWDESGMVISFYSNHLPLLQCAEFGMKIPE